jgi:hypothetical protein
VVWFVCTTVDTDLLSAVLAAFARAVGAGQDKLVVLVALSGFQGGRSGRVECNVGGGSRLRELSLTT